MNTATYQKRQQELITLLDQGTKLLPDTEEQGLKLRGVQTKLKEESFTIALVAGFQCGKSTTFDTLCDGRTLSPIGFGAKTSGCLVYAQNLDDTSKPESATIRWRSKEELIEGFFCNELPDFWIKTQNLDLDKPADVQRLREAAEEECRRWEMDKINYDPESVGLLDVVRCALLVARFYQDDAVRKLHQQQLWKPEDVSRYIQFPRSWNTRWGKGLADFKVEESIFVFVREIRLRIHAKNLARTGTVLVDCPGLFASKWDSQVAQQAIDQADAILYLIPGDRTVTQSDLQQLQKIQAAGRGHKLFYAVNLHKSVAGSEEIIEETKAIMGKSGMKMQGVKFFHFHADLALRAVQARHWLAGTLDSFTQQTSLRDHGRKPEIGKPADTMETILRRKLKLWHSVLDVSDECPDLNREGVDQADRESGLPVLLESVEDFVLQNRAEFILLKHGADHVVDVLLRVEGDLADLEKAADLNKAEHEAQLHQAEKRLKTFEKQSADFVERLRSTEAQIADYKLGEDFCRHLDECWFAEVAARAADSVNREIVKPYFKCLTDHDEIQAHMRRLIAARIEEHLQNLFCAWLEEIYQGENSTYNSSLRDRVRGVQDAINNAWKDALDGSVSILEKVPLPQLTGQFKEDFKTAASEFVPKKLDVDVGGLVTELVRSPGLMPALFAASKDAFEGFLNWVTSPFTDGDLIERGQETRSKLRAALTSNGTMSGLKAAVAPTIQKKVGASIRDLYALGLTSLLERPRRDFNRRKVEREHLLEKSLTEQRKIAGQVRLRRKNEIEPLRRKVEGFVLECRKDL